MSPLAPQVTNTPEDIGGVDYAITAVSHTSSTATYTASGHTFAAGDVVTISGISPDGYNGTYTIDSVVGATSFTITNTTNATVTVATGDVYQAPSTDYDFNGTSIAYNPNNEDTQSLVSLNSDLLATIALAQQAQADAAAANVAAISAAYTAGVAQASANGKNTSHYATYGPSGGGTAGDLWFQVDGSGTVQYQYAYNGSSWISAPISNTVISNLDAGKITAGTITGIAYNNGSGTFSVSPSGVLYAQSATIRGNIIATSGTFTGDLYTAYGNIGGFAIGGTYFQGTNVRINSDTGTITSGAITANGNISANSGITLGGTFSAGGNTFNNVGALGAASVTSSGAIVSNGDLSTPNHTTTGNAANGYVFATGGRVTRSTASSKRYKENIVDLADVPELDPRKLLDFKVRAFSYKENYLQNDDRTGVLIPGLIAEEVDAIYPLCADYADGEVENINDRAILINLLALVQEQEKRISALEAKLAIS